MPSVVFLQHGVSLRKTPPKVYKHKNPLARGRSVAEGARMTNDDRRLIVETLAEMKELKGEMQEFKKHAIERVSALEKKEVERSKQRLSVISILISSTALAVSIIVNFFRNGGK
jgi:hypothetical protein